MPTTACCGAAFIRATAGADQQDWQRRNTDMAAEDEELRLHRRGTTPRHRRAARHRYPLPSPRHSSSSGAPLPFSLQRRGTQGAVASTALLAEPELLVLDEPFDGLDIEARAQLMQLLGELHAAGQSLVLIVNRFEESRDLRINWVCWLTVSS